MNACSVARMNVTPLLTLGELGLERRATVEEAGNGLARTAEAQVVRQVFAWVGRERLTIGEVCRRLTQAGEVTRTGKTVWDRRAVWGM